MLQHLSIRNLALIESVELNFGPGLNIITGETGAGKSIIVDALLLLLGERSSADEVQHGAAKAVVEGFFSIEGNISVRSFLQDHHFDLRGHELIVRREISARGTSRSFINDSPATLPIARALGDLLVDFHGQHDHQSLLRPEHHIVLLDTVGGLAGILREYRTAYDTLRTLNEELASLLKREHVLKEQEEFRRFQLQEIEQIQPRLNEEEELEAELSIIENSEYLFETSTQLYRMLYEEENSIRDQLVRVRNLLDKLSNIDKTFSDYRADCQSSIVCVEEIARFAQSYNSGIEFSPQRLETIRERLVALARLRKKYGTIEEVLRQWAELQRELQLTENFEEEIQRLRTVISEQRRTLGKFAKRLSAKRRDTAREIEKSVIASLGRLGIPHAVFRVVFHQHPLPKSEEGALVAEIDGTMYQAYTNGIDKVEFFISTNPGEEPKPLAKTASGGEISRVMLALKTILAQSDRLPMLVFDEIDTGISGRIAQKVGIAMKNLSSYHQIISITHLPQIAALADSHIAVEKREIKKRSVISARVLNDDERMREVAKLLSGEEVTEASIQSARELANAV